MNSTPYTDCRLCPRNCGVDRTKGEIGFCGETAQCRVCSIGPHFGEEPSFSGTRGSGTIFFTGCPCGCFFCQNYQISHEGMGATYEPAALADMAFQLAAGGVHNINFVTPEHFWPHVEYTCRALKSKGVDLPMLFNSSGYLKPDMVDHYAEVIDIFMPDFKFADTDLAQDCMQDSNYPSTALAALKKMVELKGFLTPWDPEGRETAKRGVLVRHLVLPDEVENSLAVIQVLHDEFGPRLPISVMSQFHPVASCTDRGKLTRGVTGNEFREVRAMIEKLGFEHAYVQSIPDSEDFLPDFSKEEPFKGNERK